MRRWMVLVVAAAVLAGACKEDRQTSTPPEVFAGMMVMTPDFISAPMLMDPDSTEVTFTVEGLLYELVQGSETEFNLCDSRGTVRGFGTNRVTLTPTGMVGGGNCDSIRVPKGEMPTVFRGDSLYIGPTEVAYTVIVNNTTYTDVMTWHFRLKQVR